MRKSSRIVMAAAVFATSLAAAPAAYAHNSKKPAGQDAMGGGMMGDGTNGMMNMMEQMNKMMDNCNKMMEAMIPQPGTPQQGGPQKPPAGPDSKG